MREGYAIFLPPSRALKPLSHTWSTTKRIMPSTSLCAARGAIPAVMALALLSYGHASVALTRTPSIEPVAFSALGSVCAGDCGGTRSVAVNDIIALASITLGEADVSACRGGIPAGATVTVALIVEAAGNALAGCPTAEATPTPTATMTGATPAATVTPSPSAAASASVTSTPSPPPAGTATPTPGAGTPSPTGTVVAHFCDRPGSVQTTAEGVVVVPGGPASAPDLSFLHLPVGFCAHFFANVGNTRQLRFAPGGELFVASPTTSTTGGGPNGHAAILVLPDDNGDGAADSQTPFLSGLPSTQGLLFTSGYFYYQDGTRIMRVPYAKGDRTPSGSSEQVANITIYTSIIHWPKPLDVADDGTIYVGNGGDQNEICDPTRPFHGGILKLDSPHGTPVAKGFRNPISLRCSRGHNLCFAVELSRDYSGLQGGREKLVPIRQGDDWGFNCCATKDVPYPDVLPVPDCSNVAAENNSFVIGNTPFDLDFETGKWPAPWNNRVYVPLHGAAGTWAGARVVAIEMDPVTGGLLPGSDLGGSSSGAMADFASGWDDMTLSHGRPAAVAFGADGRLFLGNDNHGDIIWIAPLGL